MSEKNDFFEEGDVCEPDEGDYISRDHIHWYQYGKLVAVTGQDGEIDDDWGEQLKLHMEKHGFFPNAYLISDHGNSILLDLS